MIELLSRLADAWVARGDTEGAPFTPHTVSVRPESIEVAGLLNHPDASGPAAMRVGVDQPEPERFVVHITPIQVPPGLSPELAVFHDVLDRLAVHVDLDFRGGHRTPGAQ